MTKKSITLEIKSVATTGNCEKKDDVTFCHEEISCNDR
ncbi:hypothetical protein SPJ1_1485 [Streptococcus parauberis KRS-02083]|uniref:Lantibiotic n=1 Tax=Streptococcus parauberis KRS-02083 TaxID=1207545 RepID=A0ABN0IQ90_9STRE|nr:hypothetical protein SPJ1_1485 [Streptococcus parauberis KRS-02083]